MYQETFLDHAVLKFSTIKYFIMWPETLDTSDRHREKFTYITGQHSTEY